MTPELLQFIANCKTITAEQENKKQEKTTPKIEIKSSVNEHGAMIGDILSSVWGYDQTNYDFYEVIKVTAKTITVKKLGGFEDGKILKSKKTRSFRDGEYSININSYSNATFDPRDPKAKRRMKTAEEDSYIR